LRTANALVLLEQQYDYSGHQVNVRARVIDLRDPTKPLETTVALPAANAYSGLVQDGEDVLISHYQVTRERRARFYVSRIELSDPSTPVLGAGVNVPGSLIHYDGPSGRAITSELSRIVAKMLTFEECNQRFAYNEFTALGSERNVTDGSPIVRGTCTGLTQRLHLVRFASDGAVREDTLALNEKEIVTSSSLSDGRLLAVLGHRHAYWYGGITDCFGPCGSGYAAADGPATLLSVGGFESGRFSAGRLEVSGLSEPWWGFWGSPSVYTSGQRALVLGTTDAAVVDLRDAAAPRLERTVPLYSSPNQMHAAGRTVLLALGFNGVQRIEL
jgi:hypothetical protein